MAGVGRREDRAAAAAARARELLLFADGAQDAGVQPQLCMRARAVARELIWAVDELASERSARIAMQKQRDDCLKLITARPR